MRAAVAAHAEELANAEAARGWFAICNTVQCDAVSALPPFPIPFFR